MSKINLSKDDIKHLGKLANLSLNDQEIDVYSEQIKEIVGFVEQLDQVDVQGIKPTYQVNDNTTNVYREDKVEQSLSQKEALSQASKTHNGYFVVEGVLYEG